MPNTPTEPANFRKFPVFDVAGSVGCAWEGWSAVFRELGARLHALLARQDRVVLAWELYPGALEDDVIPPLREFLSGFPGATSLDASRCLKAPAEVETLLSPYLGDDPVFGRMAYLDLPDFFDPAKLARAREEVAGAKGLVAVHGVGATLVADPDLLVYLDLARWEIQRRQREGLVGNLGANNAGAAAGAKYKRAFFADWRAADRHKRRLFDRWDYLLDANTPGRPRMASARAYFEGLRQATRRPLMLAPFFDPGPWGGQWMKRVCGLDPSARNYAWCFNCVPEENSLLLGIGGVTLETPALNLVLRHPRELLGAAVHGRFGAEFPIRFDYLDTMGGGNLSLQVHPPTGYIQERFGMHYTQDESYYLLDAGPGAKVYLGLREDVDPAAMLRELEAAQAGGAPFDAGKHVQTWPVRKHDHVLIPAGTVHCSGAESLVLEISATPYIFTFKLWDWGRLGLDGKPRPIHLGHGRDSIQWDRRTEWTRENLVNRVRPVAEGPGWREESTGLHEAEFIETRRHWFTGPVPHPAGLGVNVLNLVEGQEILVESPDGAFDPFPARYAETWIMPADAGPYTITPHGASRGRECATVKAYVRT